MTELVFIRHGETEWNKVHRWQGHKDSPLTLNGRAQAKASADYLLAEEFDVIFSSDLGRAMETANYFSEAVGLEIIAIPKLRERCFGVLEGLTPTEMENEIPQIYEKYRSEDPDYRIPEGESARERYSRQVEGILDVARQSSEAKKVAIFCHGGVLDTIIRHTLGIPLEAARSFKVWNASVNRFSVNEEGFVLDTWGDTNHLKGLSVSTLAKF